MKRSQHEVEGNGAGASDGAGAAVYRMERLVRSTSEPMPLYRPPPEGEPFPVDALPPLLRDGVLGAHGETQAPIALCAQSVLACASLAVAKIADVQRHDGQTCPTSLFFATIAASGERKTSTDRIVIRELAAYERELARIFEAEEAEHQAKMAAFEASKAAVKRKKGADRAGLEAALSELRAPMQPTWPRITADAGATAEGLFKLLRYGHGFAGLFTSEGGSFVGSHAMKDENKRAFIAMLNEAWDGAPLKRTRSEDGSSTIYDRRLSVHIMLQPGLAERMFSDADMGDQGLLARFLVAAPASAMGTRFGEPTKASRAALECFHASARRMWRHPVAHKLDAPGELDLETITMSDRARLRIREFAREFVERNLGEGGELRPISAFANKLPEHVARLAAVFACFGDPDAREIDADAAASAITLGRWYAGEHIRVLSRGSVSAALLNAEALLAWMAARSSPRVWIGDVYMRGPAAFRVAKRARAALMELERHGLVRRVEGGCVIEGVNRKEVWEVVSETPHREAA